MIKGTLFKIKSTHSNLRTSVIYGETRSAPFVGHAFLLIGEGIEYGSRVVKTTVVQESARLGNTILFKTKNSTYCFLIEEDDAAH